MSNVSNVPFDDDRIDHTCTLTKYLAGSALSTNIAGIII